MDSVTGVSATVFNINNHFVTAAASLDEALSGYLGWCGPVYLSAWPELESAETAEEIVKIMGLRITHEVPPDFAVRRGVLGGYNW